MRWSSNQDAERITEINYPIDPDAVGIGPGMGQHGDTAQAFAAFLYYYRGALVIDADGLKHSLTTSGMVLSDGAGDHPDTSSERAGTVDRWLARRF